MSFWLNTLMWKSMVMGATVLFVGAVVSLLGYGSAFADDGGVQIQGGAARLMGQAPGISMSDEYVLIDMKPDHYRVKAIFHFFNHGASTTVAVGFPVDGYDASVQRQEFTYFKTWVNAKAVETQEISDADFPDSEREYSYFKVKQVYFPSISTTTTVVEYDAPYGNWSTGDYWIRYPYGTGASWNGPIQKAIFDIRFDETLLGLDIKISDSARVINRSRGQIVFNVGPFKPKKFRSFEHLVSTGPPPVYTTISMPRYAGFDISFRPLGFCLIRSGAGPNLCPPSVADDQSSGPIGTEPETATGDVYEPPSFVRFPTLAIYRLRRNSIYARHGYIFHDPVIKKFFAARDWYKPEKSSLALTEDEKAAVSECKEKEQEILKAPHY